MMHALFIVYMISENRTNSKAVRAASVKHKYYYELGKSQVVPSRASLIYNKASVAMQYIMGPYCQITLDSRVNG